MKRRLMGAIFKILLTAISLLLLIPEGFSQGLLNRVIKQSKRKIEQKASDLIVEKASEAIANKVYASMEDAFDKMLADAIKGDSAYQANQNDSVAIKYGQLANTWMERMNQAAEVPETYSFTHRLEIETKDRTDVSHFIMYLHKDQPIFGMEQEEDGGTRIILMDLENDVTVMYSDDEEGKKAQAIPNLLALGGSLARTQMDSMAQDFKLTRTGQSKTILGYHSEEYHGESDEYETTFYLTKDLEVDWRDAFGGMMEKFSGTHYREQMEEMSGFMLESKSQSKKKKKDVSTWETKKVERKEFSIINAEYQFGNLYSQ